jgi:hypothetical protein
MLYQTHARIHLDNIRYNIDGIRRAVGPGSSLHSKSDSLTRPTGRAASRH